jgi:NAD(P)H-hydrate epimerase
MNGSVAEVRNVPSLPQRKRDAHKGDYGRVLIVGGSVGMIGAPALAANAALRGGAGLAKIACPDVAQQAIATLAPCATSRPLPSADGLIGSQAIAELTELASEHDVLAVGPGMGQSDGLQTLLSAMLDSPEKPLIVDADGLNNLAAMGSWWNSCRAALVLTPHPGEMRRLAEGAGLSLDLNRRTEAAVAMASHVNSVVVLKGAGTVVADAKRVYVNRTGNPGMATGGSGDVLTGLIAALAAQDLDPFDAAVLGVWAHGKAGDLAAEARGHVGMIATDLLEHLPQALRGGGGL